MSLVQLLLVMRGAAFPVAELIEMTGVRGRDHHGRVDLDAFVRDGYMAIRGAVDADTVAACRKLIWAALKRHGVRRDDPGSWPVFGGTWTAWSASRSSRRTWHRR
jgi:hypothetical protein